MLAGIARRAGTVITGSEAAAREIRARWPGLGDRLRVIHHGIDPSFRPVTDGVRLAACRRALGLPERFVLVLGNLRPYKNVATVIAAMARLEAASDVHLVVAGEGARPGAPLLAAACRAAPGVRLQAIGPVAPEWLTALISLATVGACPSRREGFGLVPLEMLACGTAVVVSDIAPHREVLGEDVPRVAPDDVDGWAAQLAHLLASAVARRAQVEALAGRVASGSLAGQAAAHLEVYQAALAGRHRRPRPFA
jgi:glycosyltransferase involved in cell wall biosynthesis